MNHKQILSLLFSFRAAGKGIAYCLRTQRNMKIHGAAAVIVLIFSRLLELSPGESCVLLLTIAAVWSAEMLNTAIETVVDLVSPEYHPLAAIAKDVAAGAVLVMALAAVAVGLILFSPRIWLCIH